MCNIGLDANTLDRDGTSRDALVSRFEKLIEIDEISVVLAGGVRDEINHVHTLQSVKAKMLPRIFNLRATLNSEQTRVRTQVRNILRGNALAGKHDADASHIAEAAETGCGFFVTEDARILKMRAQLRAVLPPSLTIVSLAEFFTIYDRPEH
jgi:hypothetical protein